MANGVIVIDKPSGWTSMDVCAKLRGVFHEKRIGHGGTLDPMATGVLPVFVGNATRAVEFAEQSDKEYIATLRLGVTTDTQDTTGTVLQERPVEVSRGRVEEMLAQFTGPIQQVPPMYSAIKREGKKLYELARKGISVEREPRQITIHTLEILDQISREEYVLRVLCSKGTYIRTLCNDLGEALGCGGAMASRRRTMAAGFTIHPAVTLEEVERKGDALLLPTDCFFAQYPAYTLLTERQEKLCRNGNPVPEEGLPGGLYRVYDREGTFLCLSDYRDGCLVSVKNFFGA